MPFAAALLLSACAVPVSSGTAVSTSASNAGWLRNGVSLPEDGPGFVRARPGESTRFGIPRLVESIEDSARYVLEHVPGGYPLRVGDLSSPSGGRHLRHGSHRSGRDVDLIYYATDVYGAPARGRGWVAYDRFGTGVESRERGGEVFLLDEERNWALVRHLVMNEEAHVQWIFTSRGVKARLLRYALAHEPDPEAILRATWVLHQPSRGNPHADHFHVRIACGAEQVALGCRDRGPIWPWFGDRTQKLDAPGDALDDAFLVQALMEEMDGNEEPSDVSE